MSSVVISGDTSGAITLSAPAVAGTNTITLPAATGTVMVSGNQPAFSAYLTTAQTGVSVSTWTKCNLDTEEFDTNNNFASSRFTPTIAGYYQVNGAVDVSASGTDPVYFQIAIYKNGTAYKTTYLYHTVTTLRGNSNVSSVIYMNGSTDYLEMYGYGSGSTGTLFNSGISNTYFNGCMIRTA